MSFEQIMVELGKLNRADKLRAMQALVAQLSAEEGVSLASGETYELLTPYGNEAAAQILYEFLQSANAADQKLEP